MPEYAFSAIDAQGARVEDRLEASNEVTALDAIARRGLTPIDLRPEDSYGPWWTHEISLTGRAHAAKPTELERLFTTFAALSRAKIPLLRVLSFCESQAKGPLKFSLGRTRRAVENGQSLGKAIRAEDPIIPLRLSVFIELGEAANQLATVSQKTAELLSEERKLKSEAVSALIYPLILLIMSLFVLAVLVFFLAPTILPVFASTGADPPSVLVFLNGIKELLIADGQILFLGLLLGIAALFLSRRAINRSLSVLAFHLPLLGTFLKQRETQRFCQTLGLLISAGSTLSGALRTISETTAHSAYRSLCEEAETVIQSGGNLSDVTSHSALIDPIAQTLIQAGEEADQLDDVLRVASDTLSAQTSETLKRAVRLLTPTLTLILGLGVGAILLSVITAILDLNDVAF